MATQPNMELLRIETLNSFGILDSFPEGVYLTDKDRRIVFWNKAAERITGWSKEEVLGKSCRDSILVHIDKDGNRLCGNDRCPLHRAIITGQSNETPLLVFALSKSGERVSTEVSVAPLRDEKGEIVGGVEIFREMTVTMGDLNRARLIQQKALQFTPPFDPRLKIAMLSAPHDMVGGDFLLVEKLDDDRYAILLADITGHGVAAALYTMQLRSLWEEYHEQLDKPAEFMSALNCHLNLLANPNDYFATGVHFLINAASGEIDYACAGHPSQLLVRRDNHIEPLAEIDPCLGLFSDTIFHTAHAELAEGDSLVGFTDGAIEINNAAGEELGIEGFCKLIRTFNLSDPGPALSHIESELIKYNHQVRLPDDLTLLCIHRTKASSEA